MFIDLNHVKRVGNSDNAGERVNAVPTAANADPNYAFAYYFHKAPVIGEDGDATAHLDALADAMVEQDSEGVGNSTIPPVFTYFGQFIDHDLTAGTDREVDRVAISGDVVTPASRAAIAAERKNLRTGSLRLDSLYGDGPHQTEFSRRISSMLRHPVHPAKMWLGSASDSGLGSVPMPMDAGSDLLRLERLLQKPHQRITESELHAMPKNCHDAFLNEDGSIRGMRAVIGDERNDANLFLSQLHLAFLRLHNRIADIAHLSYAPTDDHDALYEWVRKQVRWIYQWLVVNAYLPTICQPDIVKRVLDGKARLYTKFYEAQRGDDPKQMPMPLEFSTAAFRFGQSMMRGSYDWNRYFGRAEGGSIPIEDRIGSDLLAEFTGSGRNPMFGAPDLPAHWMPEWDRLCGQSARYADRMARRIDTVLVPPLEELANDSLEPEDIARNLARKTLRRGQRLNIPSAQDCIAGIFATTGAEIEPLSSAELSSGPTGDAIRDGNFVSQTPLWFYILKEAELRADGNHLGPLGSALVAETLAGLVINDPESYWHQPGSYQGRWHPIDAPKPAGEAITTLPAFLRAAGLLA